ncbi:MAG TPA: tetratricopeptide repeat-containing protein [Desulfobacterales bacterium]|nr:tetratricopeptide repeat-containing protein [Desulfobacterales bacterium]
MAMSNQVFATAQDSLLKVGSLVQIGDIYLEENKFQKAIEIYDHLLRSIEPFRPIPGI